MATHYDIALNWASRRETTFLNTLMTAAERRGLETLVVMPQDVARIRKRLVSGSTTIGILLNTQADGSNMTSPMMRLCRDAKATGALVVEDPDDAHVYADRALQLEYLARAGMSVPRHLVIDEWHPRRSRITDAQRAIVGTSWAAQPAVGLSPLRTLKGTGPCRAAALENGDFAAGDRLIIYRRPHAEQRGRRRLYRVWYLFGEIATCAVDSDGRLVPLSTADLANNQLAGLLGTTQRLHDITGLDWFVAEMAVTRTPHWTICEPPNALAGFGPGARVLATLPDDIATIAARRLVDVAWNRRHHREPNHGTLIRMA